ncbi:MAG: phosphoadenylyl-sulfate reductase [Caulobacteraceae bacterium]|jgi:phosphoadenosine phosphosulfate reductase
MSLALEAPSRAEALDGALRDAHPRAILEAARAEFGDRLALVSSFGAESAVLLHMAAEVDRAFPVLFLETGMLFAQTLDYRRELAGHLGLTNVCDLRPRFEDLALSDPDSTLWKRDTDACCHIRKVLPLDRALAGYEAWITGRKRFQGGARLRLPVVEEADGRLKFNPLAGWSKAELDAYADAHDLPDHPLTAMGFPSIGCWPCTDKAQDGADLRSGRWAGSQKSECGIHTARAPGAAPFLGADL